MKNLNLFCCFLLWSQGVLAQYNPQLFDAMQWRMIGPHRGGRTVGAVGVPQQPNIFYIGVNNGDVWKSTDCDRIWDNMPTTCIRDLLAKDNDIVMGK